MREDVELLAEFKVNGIKYYTVRTKGGACTLEEWEYTHLLELYNHDAVEKIA